MKHSFPRRAALAGAFALLFAAPGTAPAQQHAHEHGVGRLNLAIAGQELEIELMAPGADVVGFEHEATTPEQKAAVDKAVAKLKAATALFTLPASAKCRLEEVEVESALLEDHEAEHKDDHKHGHKEDHKDAHKEGEDEETHSEFHAHYHFDCADAAALTHVETRYFKEFPTARELEVQFATPKGQGAAELTPSNPRVNF